MGPRDAQRGWRRPWRGVASASTSGRTGVVSQLVFGLLLGFVAWTLVEQLVLWLRPSWLAALSFVPLARRSSPLSDAVVERIRVPDEAAGYRAGAKQLDPDRLEWPPDLETPGVDLCPADGARPAWFRVGLEGDDPKRASARRAGVGRISVRAEGDVLIVEARWFPALLIGTAGFVAVLVGVILSLATWGVGLVMSVLVVAAWSLPAITVQRGARGWIEIALDRLARSLAQPREKPSSKKRKRRSRKRR